MKATKKRRWPIGCLTLAAAIGGLGAFLCVLPGLLPGARAIEELEALGARVQRQPYFSAFPGFLETPLFPYGDVWWVQLIYPTKASLSVDDMRWLEDFPRLEVLVLRSRFERGALAPLARLTRLKELVLFDSFVPPADFAVIGRLRRLEELDLNGTSVGDQDLEFVTHLSRLRELSLRFTRVTDRGLAHLRGCRSLRFLDISDTAVTDRPARELLQSLPQLKLRSAGARTR